MAVACGILFHHFWGTYSASIQLVFCEDPDAPLFHEVDRARGALAVLNADPALAGLSGATETSPVGGPLSTDKLWRIAEKCPAALVLTVDLAGVTFVEEQLRRHGLRIFPCGWDHCKRQCADESIGGTPHSVDSGPAFEVDVDASAAKQTAFSF